MVPPTGIAPVSLGFQASVGPSITKAAYKWCLEAVSNHRHRDFQSLALPLSYLGAMLVFSFSEHFVPFRLCDTRLDELSFTGRQVGEDLLDVTIARIVSANLFFGFSAERIPLFSGDTRFDELTFIDRKVSEDILNIAAPTLVLSELFFINIKIHRTQDPRNH